MDEQFTVRNASFELCYNAGYRSFEFLGEGAYGVVAKANRPARPDHFYAIKKISAFDHNTYCQRTLREIRILKTFRHENIIEVKDIVRAEHENPELMREIFLVQECMGVVGVFGMVIR